MKIAKILPGASILALLMSTPALAQQTPSGGSSADPAAAQSQDDSSEEIVVTGTSLRGVAPAGAETIGLNAKDVAATGATSAAQVLANIPQISDFGAVPSVQGLNNFQVSINRPSVRGLPNGVGGSSSTLILMDGHRLPGAGVLTTYPDPDVVPPGVIQRVEVVTDGGSSVYGADAVGGVINFITRRDFEGVQVNARQGFGSDYQSFESYVTAGKKWDNASAYISYNYSQHDGIYGRDRDYEKNVDWTTPNLTPLGRTCNPGNVTIGTAPYAIVAGAPPTLNAGGVNACDLSDNVTIFPQERRDSVFAGASLDATPSLRFDLRAWYTHRVDKSDGGPLTSSAVISSTNPYYIDTGDANSGKTQTVNFDWSPVRGQSTFLTNDMETWGFSPSVTADLGHEWQMRAFATYGHTVTATVNPAVNAVLLNQYVAGTNFANALDPYDVSATVNSSLVDTALDWQTYGRGENEMSNARVVFDGPLFTLPGGEVRAALGAEYLKESFNVRRGNAAFNNEDSIPRFAKSHDVNAYFAEINVPIVGADNNIPLVHSLSLALSGRRDEYSDFGSVNTPRIGLSYEPIDWITFRGNWGKSFQAPSLADTALAQASFTVFPFVPPQVINPAVPVPPGAYLIAVQGSVDNLQPQRATSYSVGFDVHPPIVRGLDLSFTYYKIDYSGQIGSPPVFAPGFYSNPAFNSFYVMNPALNDPFLLNLANLSADGATNLGARLRNGKRDEL